MSGKPAASAWACSNSALTACIATRFAASLIVVSNAPTSPSPSEWMTCSIQALSLPLLQETRIFMQRSLEGVRVECVRNELDPLSDTRSGDHGPLIVQKVDARVSDGRQRIQRAPEVNF